MTKEELKKLNKEIEKISNNFEDKPWTENIKFLKENFDINSIGTPNQYLDIINEFEEMLRETRLLFLYSAFNIVCEEEGKLYYFDKPYQAGMEYKGVMKKEGNFYLLDEDGHYREIFTSKEFMQFIDDQYWKLYE